MGTQTAKCPACREPSLRARWGCDADAENPSWEGTCEFCIGSGCPECDGQGVRRRYRCPNSMSGPDGQVALQFATAYDAGFLPSAGSYGEQGHKAMSLIGLVRMERSRIERSIAESKQRPQRG
jgi:hypothetical protein